ncbi:hypothetical protein RUMGNA_02845 [Mediterraneibacter gnavus ATCC 29149]|uniref:Uncharacterized protein n=1 Tax=Mediterraneibacter gnavus (strain ATCC 29149 / DSM 114966 / JCM 6515 / VPI C7-9) TaxID=411470 RepID=A7B5K5_MEDG7|nr:hypothetical protein RUMGNA_02845 [Mediterraneibacter gnavus ATCC 29149]
MIFSCVFVFPYPTSGYAISYIVISFFAGKFKHGFAIEENYAILVLLICQKYEQTGTLFR